MRDSVFALGRERLSSLESTTPKDDLKRGKICGPRDLKRIPQWAKRIVAAALKLQLR